MSKKIVKQILFIIFIAIIIGMVIYTMKKYDKEGEKVLPFSISKILLVSTVDGKINDDPNNIWNIDVTQVNDVYMYVDKTMDKNVTIKNIELTNFNITSSPQKGTLKLLRPTGNLSNLYTYSQQDYLNDSIIYSGAVIDDMKSLEIANNGGGMLGFRLSLENLGNYVSNEAQEITYDGKLLSNLGLSINKIKFKINYDVIITTSDDISYKGTFNLELPLNNVIEEGSSNIELTDFQDIVFKRT